MQGLGFSSVCTSPEGSTSNETSSTLGVISAYWGGGGVRGGMTNFFAWRCGKP